MQMCLVMNNEDSFKVRILYYYYKKEQTDFVHKLTSPNIIVVYKIVQSTLTNVQLKTSVKVQLEILMVNCTINHIQVFEAVAILKANFIISCSKRVLPICTEDIEKILDSQLHNLSVENF